MPEAHPRSRGEHNVLLFYRELSHGSSPLARGTRARPMPQVAHARLIPARAGNTESGLARYISPPAHPRSRGEHGSESAEVSPNHGSSPLARGTHASSVKVSQARRLIPARAGNTTLRGNPEAASPAHPRSRGEHLFVNVACVYGFGSSPLARGTRGLWSG